MQIHIEKNQKEIKEHGNYGFPVNVSVEKIEAYEQGAFLWHWHPEIELTWIMSWEMEYRVNDQSYWKQQYAACRIPSGKQGVFVSIDHLPPAFLVWI